MNLSRTISIRMTTRKHGERIIQIMPDWAGQGIAIHKPLGVDLDSGECYVQEVHGYWRLTHIPTGLSLGCCLGSLDRATGFARQWDAEFAALQPGQAMAPDRLQAWGKVMEEMQDEVA